VRFPLGIEIGKFDERLCLCACVMGVVCIFDDEWCVFDDTYLISRLFGALDPCWVEFW
jgi:hypothetical protein